MAQEYCFDVTQGGLKVASGSGPNAQDVSREAMHYGMQYAEEGPVDVRIFLKNGRSRRGVAKFKIDMAAETAGHCNGGYVRAFDTPCACGARGREDCQATFG